MSKAKLFSSCGVEHLKHVTISTWNLATGEKTLKSETDVVELCGTPLFGKDEKATGICNSCLKGWSVEGNKLTEKGLKQVKKGRVSS